MKQTGKYLIVIAGPTGVGKTAVSLELAKRFDTEIVNADSRQIYKELNIGTAKPSKAQLNTVKHHFVNHISIQDHFTAADFEEQSISLINDLFKDKTCVILSGGTGFYIKSVLEGLDEMPAVDKSFSEKLNQELQSGGIQKLQNELQAVDPDYYEKVDIQNPHRIIRALSIWRAHGITYSSLLTTPKKVRAFTPIKILLTLDRQALYDRINQRVDLMINEGLEAEVKDLAEYSQLNALQTVGYQELFDAHEGKHSLTEAVELIKRNTRRYAKRQMTWYRNQEGWTAYSPAQMLKLTKFIEENIFKY